MPEALLDEVRLAVGEACSRAVEVHQEHCPGEPVRVALTGAGDLFEVVVTNTAAGDGGMEWPPQPATDGQDPAALPAELGLAVIAGLADDVQVSRNGDGLVHAVVDAEDLRQPGDPEDLQNALLGAHQDEEADRV